MALLLLIFLLVTTEGRAYFCKTQLLNYEGKSCTIKGVDALSGRPVLPAVSYMLYQQI